jgi:histidine ammonia-lyase
MSSSPEITLGAAPLAVSDLDAVLGRRLTVRMNKDALQRVQACCDLVSSSVDAGKVIYGINTGFGHLKSVTISKDRLGLLQENLILSHSVGTGPSASAQVVRFMLLFKLQALLRGHSGVKPETVALMAALLNSDCLPMVPSRGSLGASGDLAPLAHLALPLIGHGQCQVNGSLRAGSDALSDLQLSPICLGPKEGLALINGTQYMTAMGSVALIRASRLARLADVIATMSLEALRGSADPFDERMHAVRPHRGAVQVAANVRRLLDGSAILASHANCDKVQDPYSVRCIAPVHGATRSALAHAGTVVDTEINSVTDNPILFDNGDVISGGNFHGQPLALVMDYLAMAVSELASISERRCYLLLSGADQLPPMLIEDAGLNSGLMILQYTAAALVNENKVLSTPACVDSIPTSLGQEDHVSMGATSVNKLLQIVENAETVIAVEAVCAAQGLDFRAPLRAGIGPRHAHAALRTRVDHATVDRAFGEDMAAACEMVRDGSLLNAVTASVAVD